MRVQAVLGQDPGRWLALRSLRAAGARCGLAYWPQSTIHDIRNLSKRFAFSQRREKKRGSFGSPQWERLAVCLSRLWRDYVGTHHFVVFVVDDVAVPDVSWAHGWIERVLVDSRRGCTWSGRW